MNYSCIFALIVTCWWLLTSCLSPAVRHEVSANTAPDVFTPMEDVNRVTDLTLDSLNKVKTAAAAGTARPAPGYSRMGTHPVLFLVWE